MGILTSTGRFGSGQLYDISRNHPSYPVGSQEEQDETGACSGWPFHVAAKIFIGFVAAIIAG